MAFVAGHFTSRIGMLVRWRQYRKSVARLDALPDHILKDLGIPRCDIERGVRHGR
jgi:uncharacterized protein YjiS (DUF1127 family)